MDNTLIMDVSGAWVRKSEASSAEQMNALADEKERQFVAKYLGDAIDPIGTEAATDRDIEKSDLSLQWAGVDIRRHTLAGAKLPQNFIVLRRLSLNQN